MSNDINPDDAEIATIKSFVISTNMKHFVTSHEDHSLILWNVDFNDKIIERDVIDNNEAVLLHESKELLELSNDKLLIYFCDDNPYLRDLEASKFSPITKPLSDKKKSLLVEKKHLRFLPNDDLLLLSIPLLQEEHSRSQDEKIRIRDLLNGEHLLNWLLKEKRRFLFFLLKSLPLTPSVNVYSKASLKNSKKSSGSYRIPTIGHLGIEMINVSRIEKKNEQIFLALDGVILLLNTETMKIENHYIIPNIKKEQLNDPTNCGWMGTINEEGSLLAICSTYKEEIHTYVFSMNNGILISSRKDLYEKGQRIQFINFNNTDILMLHKRVEDKIKYTIMSPYELSYAVNDEHRIQKSIQYYMILYDQMKHDHNLFIYLNFNIFKDGIRELDKMSRCEGKNLIWEFQNSKLKVYKKDQMQSNEKNSFKFIRDIQFTHLQLLSNDDVALYCCGIYILGFDEKTNRIVPRYYYPNTNDFITSKTLPNPILKGLKLYLPLQSIVDLINELLSSRKYLVEMSDDIINRSINRKKCGRKKMAKLIACLDKIYEATEENTDPTKNYRFCDLITKYLPKLYLHIPTYYSMFIADTTLIPTPYINESYLSSKLKLVGYTYQAHTLQVYNRIESYFIQRILLISRAFVKYIQYISKKDKPRRRVARFVVPYLGFTKYPSDYNFWKELLRPSDNPFVTLADETIYDGWNAEALLNFKWNAYGWFYFYLFWGSFNLFMFSFGVGSTLSSSSISSETRHIILYTSITVGFFHLTHEIRQFIWKPSRYVKDIWNLFDLAAIIFPICTAFFWLTDHEKPSPALISISNLFLYFKFITFLRALDYFGSNLTIIVGVAKRILSFLLILLIIIIGFAHAFFIILTPNHDYDLNVPVKDDDPNNPWNLVTEYQSVTPNGDISPETTFIQRPDSKLNLFSTYSTSLMAMYLFLTGDYSSLGSWSYQENPFMTILLVMFSFLIVVYLMNLFIGLLNLEIEGNRTHFLFILQKAKIVAEIELFLLLPNQRRWRHWFPDMIFYQMPIGEVQQKIMDIDNNPVSYHSTKISDKLRGLAKMKEITEGPMSKAECEVLFSKFKDEIRILLNLDKNVDEVDEGNKSKNVVEKQNIVIEIDDN
ncbi:4780_t:CDS:2 [Funneliformis caledonium]|uniref:4780_t:CDS:1 n=1 Tax=Funneliformis caledonium TaxID=1117310 RepID=A0A9N9N5E9_9GLOM|nr:4780_t:CDS:2 [Funneliformis caledonium]